MNLATRRYWLSIGFFLAALAVGYALGFGYNANVIGAQERALEQWQAWSEETQFYQAQLEQSLKKQYEANVYYHDLDVAMLERIRQQETVIETYRAMVEERVGITVTESVEVTQ